MSQPVLPSAAFEIDQVDPLDDEQVKEGLGARIEFADTAEEPEDLVQFRELTIWQTVKVFRKAVTCGMLVAVGAMYDCYAAGVPGAIIANRSFIKHFGTVFLNGQQQINVQYISAWGAAQGSGAFLGFWTAPVVTDRLGAKVNLVFLTLAMCLANVVELTSHEWIQYFMGRLFAGFALGLVQATLPVYISEVAPTKVRGFLLCSYSFWFAIGGWFSSIALQVIDTKAADWRIAFYSEYIILVAFLPALIFCPETPAHWAKRGNEAKCRACIANLYGGVQGFDLDKEYRRLAKEMEQSKREAAANKRVPILACFKGVNLRRTLIATLPLVYQSTSGLGIPLGYLSYFLQLAGYSQPFLPSVIINTTLTVFIFISFFTVERYGRRSSLLIGGVVMSVSILIIGVLGTLKTLVIPALVTMSCIFMAAYSLSAGPVAWALMAEIPTADLRAKTASCATTLNSAIGLIWGYATPFLISPQGANLGIKSGFFWFGTGIVTLILVYFFVPETKGRSYSELDQLFAAKVSARKFQSHELGNLPALPAVVQSGVEQRDETV